MPYIELRASESPSRRGQRHARHSATASREYSVLFHCVPHLKRLLLLPHPHPHDDDDSSVLSLSLATVNCTLSSRPCLYNTPCQVVVKSSYCTVYICAVVPVCRHAGPRAQAMHAGPVLSVERRQEDRARTDRQTQVEIDVNARSRPRTRDRQTPPRTAHPPDTTERRQVRAQGDDGFQLRLRCAAAVAAAALLKNAKDARPVVGGWTGAPRACYTRCCARQWQWCSRGGRA